MELTRSQYKQLLEILDNDIVKSDSIAELIEWWTLFTHPVSMPVPFFNAQVGWQENLPQRTFDGRDPSKVWGVRDTNWNLIETNGGKIV